MVKLKIIDMEFLMQVIVVAFILLVIGIVKIFYKFEERPNAVGEGVFFTGMALLLVYLMSFVIYGMAFDSLTYELFANSKLAYMTIGIIVIIKLLLVMSMIHQSSTLKPKRKIKIERLDS